MDDLDKRIAHAVDRELARMLTMLAVIAAIIWFTARQC